MIDSQSGVQVGAPVLPMDALRSFIGETYGLETDRLSIAGGEVDLNVRARTNDGDYLIKVRRANLDVQQWQDEILLHMAATDPDIPAPRLVDSCEGSFAATLNVDGVVYSVRVYDWKVGYLLAAVKPTPELLHEIGDLSARITSALASFLEHDLPTHPWDLRRADHTVDAHLAAVNDPADRAAVTTIMRWFDEVKPAFEDLPLATVHHDLNDFNIVVAHDGGQHVSGVIDFNDALRTMRVVDPAIAAGYAMLRHPEPVSAAGVLMRGYHQRTALSETEMRVAFTLAASRLCLNATIWTGRAAGGRDDYGARRMAATWPVLHTLAAMDRGEAEGRFLQACTAHTLSEAMTPR